MAGFLETQSNANQTEAVYIAYFTRAADGGGYLYWTDQFAADESAGLSPAQSAAQISQSFAVQPEATAAYAFLASPPAILSTTDPTQIAAVDSFIIQVYQNLFNRAVTSSDGGVQYWQNQILSGAITVGEAVYAIGNGATGADASVLGYKISAATAFTSDTFAANVGASAPLSAAFISGAKVAVTGVVDAASEAASVTASAAFAANAVLPNLTLTPGNDTLATGATGAIFNAPLVTTPFSVPGQPAVYIVGGTNTYNQTLTAFDSMTDTAGDGILNAQLKDTVTGSVVLTGIATANLTTIIDAGGAVGTSGFQGNVTGLKTVNDISSDGNIRVGGAGAGLTTALTTVNITNPSNGPYAPGVVGGQEHIFTAYIAHAALAGAADAIAVSLTNVGGTAGAGEVNIGPDNAAANGYETWNITNKGSNYVQLGANGATSATTITIAGTDALELSADKGATFSNVTSIDAHTLTGTGTLTISGQAAGQPGGYTIAAGPGIGLLAGNGALTSFSGGAETTLLDISSLTAAEVAHITTLDAGTGTGTNTVIFSNAALEGVSAAVTGIAHFQDIGVGTALQSGTINLANFGTAANEISLYADLTGAPTVTIDGGTNPFTLNLSGDTAGFSPVFTVNGPATGLTNAFNLDLGSAGHADSLGALAVNGYGQATFALAAGPIGGVLSTDAINGNITFTPNAGAALLTIDGLDNLVVGGSITGVGQIVDTASGVVTIDGTNTATSIIAATSGGIDLLGGSLGNNVDTGVTLTGSASHANILNGSLGADTFNAGSGGDTIITGGGTNLAAGADHADVVNLVSGATDHILVAAGTAAVGGAVFATPNSITDSLDNAQPGWWGLGVGQAPAQFGGLADNTGTGASAVQINGFHAGALASGGDVIDISQSAWGFSGVHQGLNAANLVNVYPTGGPIPPGVSDASFISNPTGSGGTVNYTAADPVNVVLLNGNFAGPNVLAGALHLTNPITFAGPLTAGNDSHVLVLYQDGTNTHLADVELSGGVATANTANLTEHVSDLAVLVGVSASNLVNDNIHFVA